MSEPTEYDVKRTKELIEKYDKSQRPLVWIVAELRAEKEAVVKKKEKDTEQRVYAECKEFARNCLHNCEYTAKVLKRLCNEIQKAADKIRG